MFGWMRILNGWKTRVIAIPLVSVLLAQFFLGKWLTKYVSYVVVGEHCIRSYRVIFAYVSEVEL